MRVRFVDVGPVGVSDMSEAGQLVRSVKLAKVMRVPSVGESLEVIEALKALEVGENSAVAKQYKQTNRQPDLPPGGSPRRRDPAPPASHDVFPAKPVPRPTRRHRAPNHSARRGCRGSTAGRQIPPAARRAGM